MLSAPDIRATLHDPEEYDELGSRLRTFCGSTLRPETLSLSPNDRAITLDQMLQAAARARSSLKRGLTIGIDITCCPPFLSLGFSALAFKSGLANKISIFYAEGKYPEPVGVDEKQEMFTVGEWDVVAIPGLISPWSPGRPRLYVVAVGFEGNKTLRLCERREPDQIIALLPDPGVLPGYVDRTKEQNRLLFERFDIQDANLLRANAADAVDAWRVLSQYEPNRGAALDTEFLCCGTKPHSLGMCLHSLTSGQGVVCDIVAEDSRHACVEEAGMYWRYDIENHAVV